MKPVRLSTRRLVLDAPDRGDLQLITQYCQDPRFVAWMTLPWPYRREHAEYFVDRIVDPGWADDSEYTWALRDVDGAPLKGVIGWRRGGRDLGYWLGAPHRGNGFMTEAVTAVCDWLFANGEELVTWEAVIPNTDSLAIARRAGFSFTGQRPSGPEMRDGSHPPAWHAVLHREDTRTPKDGWPA
jgi:RimJ/RimL family protein N-acetyltransferase